MTRITVLIYLATLTYLVVFIWMILVPLGPLSSTVRPAHTPLFQTDPQSNPFFWGTWRPNLYFGLRAMSTASILAGLMWFRPYNLESLDKVRHDCKQDDQVESYGYDIHNGLDYAKQSIKDPLFNVHLTIEWIKVQVGSNGGDWIAKFKGVPLSEEKPLILSLLFYTGFEGDTGNVHYPYATKTTRENQYLMLKGETSTLGDFSMYVHLDPTSTAEAPRITSMTIPEGSVWNIKKFIQAHFSRKIHSKNKPYVNDPSLFYLNGLSKVSSGNTIVTQLVFQDSFEFEVSFISHSAHPKKAILEASNRLKMAFDTLAKQKELEFSNRFEAIFGLSQRGFTADQLKMGKYALSNLIGSIGFFTGPIEVNEAPDIEGDKFHALYYSRTRKAKRAFLSKEKRSARIRASDPGTLFTATPSRSFFPRGFFWDEGFHQLILLHWNPLLTEFCLASWYDRMDENGWIAREQILGSEAASKVPNEFRVQSTHIANPPTHTLALTKLLRAESRATQAQVLQMKKIKGSASGTLAQSPFRPFLQALFPRLESHFSWYLNTQSGIHDQFDRSYENDKVFRWRGRTHQHNLASGLDDYPRSNPPHMGELHVDLTAWMREYAAFLEEMAHGLGKNASQYRTLRESIEANLNTHFFHPEEKIFADLAPSADGTSTEFVVHKGYVALIPWVLNLDLRGAPYESGLQLVKDLMTAHGIASLHPSDPNYRRGENYWRGNLWVNFQYLVLRALHYHQQHDTLHAPALYMELRNKIIQTLFNEFARTGFLFETYDELDGKGLRSRPFTGWSSLILLIMAELY